MKSSRGREGIVLTGVYEPRWQGGPVMAGCLGRQGFVPGSSGGHEAHWQECPRPCPASVLCGVRGAAAACCALVIGATLVGFFQSH